MEKDTQVVQIKEQNAPLIERGNTMVIDSAESMEEAADILSQANKALDTAKKKKDEVMRPILDAAAAERKRWKPLEDMLGGVIKHLRAEMGRYQTEMLKKKAEEDAKIAARVGEGKGKFKPETAIKKMEDNTPEARVETDSGKVSFKPKKQLKITDESQIPKEYWIVDEDKVFDALTSGTPVPGAEIEVIQIPVNRR